AGVERAYRGRERLLHLQRPRDADLAGPAGSARAPPVAFARSRDPAADGDGLRSRPGPAGEHRRLLPGRPPAAGDVRRAGTRVLTEDLGVEGPPGLPAAERRRRHLRTD